MKRVEEDSEFNVEGLIQLAARDLDGSILAVNIVDRFGQTYLVDDTKMGSELLLYLGSGVNASGHLRLEDGSQILRVTKYSIQLT